MPLDPRILSDAKYAPWLPPLENAGHVERWQKCARRDAGRMFDAFLFQIPHRIAMLERVVRAVPCFDDWRADFSEESFRRLGPAFLVLYRPRWLTPEELEVFGNRHIVFPSAPKEVYEGYLRNPRPPQPTLDFLIDDGVASLWLDGGVYMGEAILRANSTLKWELRASAPTHILHQLPVIYTWGGNSWAFSPHSSAPGYGDLIEAPSDAWTCRMKPYMARARGVPDVPPPLPPSSVSIKSRAKKKQ